MGCMAKVFNLCLFQDGWFARILGVLHSGPRLARRWAGCGCAFNWERR